MGGITDDDDDIVNGRSVSHRHCNTKATHVTKSNEAHNSVANMQVMLEGK